MIIADKLKQKNRAEYLLYLWQVEDIIRAYSCDAERIAKEYVNRFDLTPEQRKQTEQWYADLCDMMRSENKLKTGHLQICNNVLQQLTELHVQLLQSDKFPYYKQMYYKVLPYIVEIRHNVQTHRKGTAPADGTTATTGPQNESYEELDTLFNMLYGVMMLRLQQRQLTKETEQAVKDTSAFLGQLSDYYFKDKECPIEF